MNLEEDIASAVSPPEGAADAICYEETGHGAGNKWALRDNSSPKG